MHANAPLTPQGRLRLCQRIESGWTIAAAATADATAEVGVAAAVACMRYGNRVPQVLRGLHHLGIELSLMGSHVLGMHLELPHLNRMAAGDQERFSSARR